MALGWICIDLYHGVAILLFCYWKQCNQTEAGRDNSLVSFYVMRISTIIVTGYTGNMTKMAAVWLRSITLYTIPYEFPKETKWAPNTNQQFKCPFREPWSWHRDRQWTLLIYEMIFSTTNETPEKLPGELHSWLYCGFYVPFLRWKKLVA